MEIRTSPLVHLAPALAALALGCASTPKASATRSARDYAPLEVGATWTYAMQYIGQAGEMDVTFVKEEGGYVVDDKNGALSLTPKGLRDRDRYLIMEPIEVGMKWKAVVGPSAVEHFEVESVGARCDTLAGAFEDCLVVHGSIRRDKKMALHIRWTWAKGVGLVRLETEAEIEGKGLVPQTKQELKRYSVGGKRGGAPPEPAEAAPAEPKPKAAGDDGPDTWESD